MRSHTLGPAFSDKSVKTWKTPACENIVDSELSEKNLNFGTASCKNSTAFFLKSRDNFAILFHKRMYFEPLLQNGSDLPRTVVQHVWPF